MDIALNALSEDALGSFALLGSEHVVLPAGKRGDDRWGGGAVVPRPVVSRRKKVADS